MEKPELWRARDSENVKLWLPLKSNILSTYYVEFVQDKSDLLDSFSVGQPVKIGINLRGREWVNPQGEIKYFNSIQGWRIAKGSGQAAPAAAPAAMPNIPAPSAAAFNAPASEDDDLPF